MDEATIAVQSARAPQTRSRAERLPSWPIAEPIVQTSSFALTQGIVDDLRQTGGRESFSYTRLANPTTEAAGHVLAALEGAETALVLSSGMAAIATSLMALLPPAGQLLASEELYGDAAQLLDEQFAQRGFGVSRVPLSALTTGQLQSLDRADVVYVETLSNPMLRVADIATIADRVHRLGALLVVDDTFTSPINLKPLSRGADLVVASATKYLNGHSDVVAGVVCGPAERVRAVAQVAASIGCSADPFASYLLLRGLKTLPLRVRRQNETALWLGRQLTSRPEVELVAHPFLESHPDHDLATSTLAGGGGVVTIRLAGGDGAAHLLQDHLALIRPATSLGGVESVVCLPSETSHLTLSEEERQQLGILPGTMRFSFGLEDRDDLLEDLGYALEVVASESAGQAAAPAAGRGDFL
jgi:cystathionine beta-lyase/cystathionine gamma-synthase